MKFFIDTANLNDILKANKIGILDGVTTNPSLMSKENIVDKTKMYNHYKKICNAINGDVSAEVLSSKYEDIIVEAENLSKIHNNIVVKIPMTIDGVKAINTLSKKNIKTNCTLVFSVGQAILSAKVGATYVSPFIGRIDDINMNGLQLIKAIKSVFKNYNIKTQILAASIRDSMHIVHCAMSGADVITSSLKNILNLSNHPLTDIGIDKFMHDFKNNHQNVL